VARWAEDKVVLRRSNLAEVQGVAAGLIAGIEDGDPDWGGAC
jgi:predicted transcriptional regulator